MQFSRVCFRVCVSVCSPSVLYCDFILFLFLFCSSSCFSLFPLTLALGKSWSSVSVLVKGWTCHLSCLWQLLRSGVVLQGPPLVLQRENILIGHHVGCSGLCAWNQPPSLAVNLSWVASLHPREAWHSLYLSDDQHLHTASYPPPHNPDTGRKIYVIQGLHSDLYKSESPSQWAAWLGRADDGTVSCMGCELLKTSPCVLVLLCMPPSLLRC